MMKKDLHFKKTLVTLALSCVSLYAFSQDAQPTNGTEIKALTEKLHQKFKSTEFGDIKATPFAGIYEVDMGRNIGYTDSNGEIFMFGHLFNMTTQEDLTQKRADELTKIDFSKLPLKDAIKVVKGTGAHKFAVFSDPDCPFCKRLEENLGGIANYTEYVFLFPLDGLHPGSSVKAESVWCSKDRASAWTKIMTKNISPETKSCDNPIERNAKLGASFSIQGTPTLISETGKVAPGAIDGPLLINFLGK